MATMYVSSTGSNTSPYDTWAKAATNPQLAINLLAADGDEVVFDDEAHVVGTLSDASIIAASGASFTIKSRSDNPLTCTLDRNHATGNIFFWSKVGNDWNFTFQGLGLKNSTTFTGAGGAALRASTNFTGSADFVNCKLDTFDFDLAGAHFGPLIRLDGAIKGLTIDETTISNITGSSSYAGAFDSYIYVANGPLTIPNLTVNGVTKTQTVNDQPNLGMIRAKGGNVTIGTINIDNYTSACPLASTGAHYAFMFFDNAGFTTTVDNLYVLDSDESGATITKTGGQMLGGAFHTSNVFNIKNAIIENVSVSEDVVNGYGAGISAAGDAAQGTIGNFISRNCTAQHGCAVYMSQGAGVKIVNIVAHDNVATGRAGVEAGAGAGCYFGGWGDCSIDNGLFYDNVADEAGAIYSHVHASVTRAKTTTLNKITCYNNTVTGDDSGRGGESVYVAPGTATYPHTCNITNSIFWDGGTDEIHGTVSDDLILNIDHCNVRGGAAAVTGEDTYTNNIDTDPLFTDSSRNDFSLTSASPCLNAGVDVVGSLVEDGLLATHLKSVSLSAVKVRTLVKPSMGWSG